MPFLKSFLVMVLLSLKSVCLLRRSWPKYTKVRSASASSSSSVVTPRSVFLDRLASGELTEDRHQAAVIDRFEELHRRLGKYSPPEPGAGSSVGTGVARVIRGALFGGSGHPAVRSPPGLYLWGTVGGGKTMLMDLFFETVEAEGGRKARVHYHDFMQVVHNLMHDAKKSAPPRDISRCVRFIAHIIKVG